MLSTVSYDVRRDHCLMLDYLWNVNYFRESIKKSILQAFTIAFTQAALACVYAAGWRLAAFLIDSERIEVIDVFR